MKSSAATRASKAARRSGSSAESGVAACFWLLSFSSVVYMAASYNNSTGRSINDRPTDAARKTLENRDIAAVFASHPYAINARAARNGFLPRLRRQPLAVPARRQEDDGGLVCHRARIARIAGIGERRVGEREDHPALRHTVAVEHGALHRHADAGITFAHLLDDDAERLARAFPRVQVVGNRACERIGVHRVLLVFR